MNYNQKLDALKSCEKVINRIARKNRYISEISVLDESDIKQELLIKAWDVIDKYNGESSNLIKHVTTACNRQCVDLSRKNISDYRLKNRNNKYSKIFMPLNSPYENDTSNNNDKIYDKENLLKDTTTIDNIDYNDLIDEIYSLPYVKNIERKNPGIMKDILNGNSGKEIAKKHNVGKNRANAIRYYMKQHLKDRLDSLLKEK